MRRLLFVLGCLTLTACGDPFQYSPYQTDVPDDKRALMEQNLERLQSKSTAAFTPFKFAVASDTHTWYDETNAAVNIINSRDDLDFLVVNGDLTDNGRLREFLWTEKILARLRIPYLTVVGAHEGITNAATIYSKMYGPLNYAFVYNHVKFVMANTNGWEFPGQAPDFQWIERELGDGYLYNHVIFMAHAGPFDRQFDAPTGARYGQLLIDYNVTQAIYGHAHEPRDVTAPAGGGVPFSIVGSISNRTFIIVDVSVAGVNIERVSY